MTSEPPRATQAEDRFASMIALCRFVDPALLSTPECHGQFPWQRQNCDRWAKEDGATCDDARGRFERTRYNKDGLFSPQQVRPPGGGPPGVTTAR